MEDLPPVSSADSSCHQIRSSVLLSMNTPTKSKIKVHGIFRNCSSGSFCDSASSSGSHKSVDRYIYEVNNSNEYIPPNYDYDCTPRYSESYDPELENYKNGNYSNYSGNNCTVKAQDWSSKISKALSGKVVYSEVPEPKEVLSRIPPALPSYNVNWATGNYSYHHIWKPGSQSDHDNKIIYSHQPERNNTNKYNTSNFSNNYYYCNNTNYNNTSNYNSNTTSNNDINNKNHFSDINNFTNYNSTTTHSDNSSNAKNISDQYIYNNYSKYSSYQSVNGYSSQYATNANSIYKTTNVHNNTSSFRADMGVHHNSLRNSLSGIPSSSQIQTVTPCKTNACLAATCSPYRYSNVVFDQSKNDMNANGYPVTSSSVVELTHAAELIRKSYASSPTLVKGDNTFELDSESNLAQTANEELPRFAELYLSIYGTSYSSSESTIAGNWRTPSQVATPRTALSVTGPMKLNLDSDMALSEWNDSQKNKKLYSSSFVQEEQQYFLNVDPRSSQLYSSVYEKEVNEEDKENQEIDNENETGKDKDKANVSQITRNKASIAPKRKYTKQNPDSKPKPRGRPPGKKKKADKEQTPTNKKDIENNSKFLVTIVLSPKHALRTKDYDNPRYNEFFRDNSGTEEPISRLNTGSGDWDSLQSRQTRSNKRKTRLKEVVYIPEKKRKLGPRSKNGCWTCRVRHKACPEDRPECGQCRRLQLVCDYSVVRPAYMFDPTSQLNKLKEIRSITNQQKRTNFSMRRSASRKDYQSIDYESDENLKTGNF